MKVVFLCGGIGKRMFPITEDKFLLKFLGKRESKASALSGRSSLGQ